MQVDQRTVFWGILTAGLVVLGCASSSGENGADAAMDTGMEPSIDAAGPTDVNTSLDVDTRVQGDSMRAGDSMVPDDIGREPVSNPDHNGDGSLDILVIGTNTGIVKDTDGFSPTGIAEQLQSILTADASLSLSVNVVAEDVYRSQQLTTGYGQSGEEYNWVYYAHSLAQYYYWPEGRDARLANLAGQGDADWDHVILAGDPHIVATVPGYFSLGVNHVAAKVQEGDAQTHVLMVWPRDEKLASMAHFAEFTHRTADGAKTPVSVIPAGRAWGNLAADKKDVSNTHPSPNGAYLAAASIYAHLLGKSAASSDYDYDDVLADAALSTVTAESEQESYAGPRSFVSPFKGSGIPDRVLNYNHTGTSSENGIRGGLKWVLGKAQVALKSGGDPPINFNYGRANTEFEANKRYKIDPQQFDFSLGFPMQDHSNYGNTTMLYGLDKRRHSMENGTDLGVAGKMVRDAELPYARAIPIRTLLAQMKDAYPEQSGYSDGWHMNGDLNKAVGAYMYTLLTGHCALDAEPENKDSNEWRSWSAHKIGYETAWTLMHLRGNAPGFKVMPDSQDSVSVTPTESAGLSISFANAPTESVTVSVTTDNDAAVQVNPTTLTFTPQNYNVPQTITMLGLDGELANEPFIVSATTDSNDAAFDDVVDRWEYTVIR